MATRSYRHPGGGRGWLGVRFQARPGAPPSEVLIHANLFDGSAVGQQEALGVLGVNLIHGAYFHHREPEALIGALLDEVGRARVEIDMIRFAGPAFAGVDNRVMSLQLVEQKLTDAAMFTAAGEVVQPSEVLHGKPVLVERGRFRPITKLTLDILERARDRFLNETEVQGREPVVLMEMTLHDLDLGEGVDHEDFLARADILGRLGLNVLISRFEQYYQLAEYVVGSTDGLIGIAVSLPDLREIASERPFDKLAGGILESTGRLFKRSVKMYVHPTRDPATGEIREVAHRGPAASVARTSAISCSRPDTSSRSATTRRTTSRSRIPTCSRAFGRARRAGSRSCRRRWRTRSWRAGCSGIAGDVESGGLRSPETLSLLPSIRSMTGEGSR